MPPKTKTVLIADDDALTVAFLTAALRHAGFNVLVARDAMQAVMSTHRNRPDAILMDVEMPGGTGLQALQKIKASSLTMNIPVVVVSGSEDPEMPEKVRALGASDFVKKPIDPSEIQRLVTALLAE